MDDAIDRWFKFIADYNKESSVPLSYVLLPNPATTGFRTCGSPIGMTKLNKSEWSKVAKLNEGRAYCSASTANKSNGTGGRGGVISPSTETVS